MVVSPPIIDGSSVLLSNYNIDGSILYVVRQSPRFTQAFGSAYLLDAVYNGIITLLSVDAAHELYHGNEEFNTLMRDIALVFNMDDSFDVALIYTALAHLFIYMIEAMPHVDVETDFESFVEMIFGMILPYLHDTIRMVIEFECDCE